MNVVARCPHCGQPVVWTPNPNLTKPPHDAQALAAYMLRLADRRGVPILHYACQERALAGRRGLAYCEDGS